MALALTRLPLLLLFPFPLPAAQGGHPVCVQPAKGGLAEFREATFHKLPAVDGSACRTLVVSGPPGAGALSEQVRVIDRHTRAMLLMPVLPDCAAARCMQIALTVSF